MPCSLWCGSGRCVSQGVHILIKIPAFAGMTGGEAGMTERKAGLPWERQSPHWHTSGSGKRQALEFAAEICLGTHPLRHPCTRRRYVHPGVIPAHAAVTSIPRRHSCTRRRYVPPRRHSCTRRRYVHHGVIPVRAAVTSTPGVIPAKAGILTRISFY